MARGSLVQTPYPLAYPSLKLILVDDRRANMLNPYVSYATWNYSRKELVELYGKLKPVYDNELKKYLYVRDCFLSNYGCTNPVNGAFKELDAVFEHLETERVCLEEIYKTGMRAKKGECFELPYPTDIRNQFIVGYTGILASFAKYYDLKHDFYKPEDSDVIALALGAEF